MRWGIILCLMMVGCGGSFDMHALEAPRLATGRVHTVDGDLVEVPQIFEAEVQPKRGEATTFQRPEDVAVHEQQLYVRRSDGSVVAMPVADVERIEVTDSVARRDTIILGVIGGVAGAAAIIGGLVYVSTQADPW